MPNTPFNGAPDFGLPDEAEPVLADTTPAITLASSLQAKNLLGVSPRGPGLLESIIWFLGAWGVHVAGLLLTAGTLVLILTSSGMAWNDVALWDFLESQQLTLLAGEQFFFVSAAVVLAWLRLRGHLGHRLGSRPLAFEHFFLLTCLIIPVSTISTQLHAWGMQGWQELLNYAPHLRSLDGLQAMDLMAQLTARSPLWAMILIFAIAPALGEELIFRGVIGRGLVARWGVIPGVLVTSVLFALAHVHPVHALAVLPMGIVLHYVYLTTRSFWAPLYLHFGNNALAVLSSRTLESPLAAPSPEGLSVSALLTVTLSLTVFLAFLWQTRVHYVLQDGTEWQPRRPSLELPVEIPLQRTFSPLSWRISLGGLVPLVGFLIAVSTQI